MEITDTTAFVTGANRGLGRQLVDALLDRGARRVYAAARDTTTLTDLDDRVVPIRLDITSREQIADAARAAADVRLLINNASAAEFAGPLAADHDAIERELATNYVGTLDVIRAFVPAMEAGGGGTIANVLSLLALASTPGMAGYSASKAASHSMTQALRPELAGRGIALRGVYPGGIDTDMLAGIDAFPKTAPRIVAEGILDGLAADLEDIFPDPTSEQMSGMWWSDPKAFERAFSGQ